MVTQSMADKQGILLHKTQFASFESTTHQDNCSAATQAAYACTATKPDTHKHLSMLVPYVLELNLQIFASCYICLYSHVTEIPSCTADVDTNSTLIV